MQERVRDLSMAEEEVTEQNPQMEEATDQQETELHQQDIIDDSKNQSMTLTEDQSSPRSVLQTPTLGPSDSSSSDNSGSCTSSTEEEKERALIRNTSLRLQYWRNVIDALKKKSMCRFSTTSLLGGHQRRNGASKTSKKKKLLRIRSADDPIDCGLLRFQKPSWRSFDLAELAAATRNFSPENLIGKGGQAEVYKGELPDGQIVAVKKLIKKDKDEERKTADFLSELGIIAHIDHPNAARLLGFGVDGGLHLVLQFSPHGSLSSLLHGPPTTTEPLEWKVRYKVAVGVALGLQYLHYSCQRRIIHRDIKASNILLTLDFEAQISDFGLAKWLPEKWVHHVVFPIEGTFGYLAPEYFMHGIINEKTDVFAFGVLLLELITGRQAVDSSRQSLVLWAKPLLDSNNMKELADPRLGEAYNVVEMKRVCLTASMCIHHLEKMRPDMNQVVQILKGEDGLVEWKQHSLSGRALMLDACDMDDYTCSTYLKDLNRHQQLALE